VDATGAAKTAATVAGAIFTAGLSLIAQETTLRLMQDSNPCGTASNRMLAARIGDVSPAVASPRAGSRTREEYGSGTPE
jgi:hypothetical protein